MPWGYRSVGAALIVTLLLPAALAARVDAGQKEPSFYDHYAAVLERFVDEDGMVDYRALKANRGELDAFVEQMARLERSTYRDWTDRQKIAFWINAYNALTLKTIINHYPIKPTFPARLIYPNNSIRQIEGVWDDIEHTVMGEDMTLEEIEHEVLRKEFDEPRIHVALVCAAMGCPPLLDQPYRGAELDEQLDGRARRMLADPKKFRIERGRERVYLSPIFDWFGKDFINRYAPDSGFEGHSRAERAVLNYLSRHVDAPDRRYLRTGDYKVKYLDYDWSLNEQDES